MNTGLSNVSALFSPKSGECLPQNLRAVKLLLPLFLESVVDRHLLDRMGKSTGSPFGVGKLVSARKVPVFQCAGTADGSSGVPAMVYSGAGSPSKGSVRQCHEAYTV